MSGMEWLVDAFECDVAALRDAGALAALCDELVNRLDLSVLGAPLIHRFGGPGGVTALYLLAESHLACHTYPERALATFNLYCCRPRARFDWSGLLSARLGAGRVAVTVVPRGQSNAAAGLGTPGRAEAP
jgi:S-adenosylmethionine decarboxylase